MKRKNLVKTPAVLAAITAASLMGSPVANAAEQENVSGYEQESCLIDADETPEGETPEGETPEGETPEGETPEGDAPKGETPEGEEPEGEAPEGETSEGEAPEGEAPEGEAPEGEIPEGEAPEGETSEGEAPEGEIPEGEAPEGETSEGEAPEGETPEGEASEEETSEGEAPEGEAPKGEASEGKTPEGEASEGEAPEGEAPKGDAPEEEVLVGAISLFTLESETENTEKNGWIQEGENWCYYENDIKVTDSEVSYYDMETGVTHIYRVDEYGNRISSNWYTDAEGNKYYYDENGDRASGGIQEIDGSKYILDENGILVIDNEYYYYDDALGVWRTIRADENGCLVTGWYEDESGEQIYYDENGSRAEGVQEIEGKKYYFNNGYKLTDYTGIIEGKFYSCDSEGVITFSKEVTSDGWLQAETDWYYVKDGELAWNCLITSGGYTYYLDHNGKMCTDSVRSIYDEEAGEWHKYAFDKNGHMLTDSWYTDEYGNEYYLGNDGIQLSGIQKIGDYWYYLYEWGGIVKNTSFDHYNEETDTYDSYRFDSEGHAITGWYQEYEYEEDPYEGRYYYGEDGRRAKGITVIDGEIYWFSDSGDIQRDYAEAKDGIFYYFGDNGKAEVQKSVTDNTWVLHASDWYYVKNGKCVKNQMLEINGYSYFFWFSGKMATDHVIDVYDEEEEQLYTYYFDSNGHMKTGWYQAEDSEKYYFDENGRAVDGLQTIDGATYYFEGTMCRDFVMVEKGIFYYFGNDGKAQIQKSADTDGWIKAGEDWYYLKNKDLLRNQFVQSGSYIYYMDSEGKMAVNRSIWIEDEETGRSYQYRLDANGHVITGWYESWGSRYYYDESGRAVEGLQSIDGEKYYFDSYGEMLTDYTVEKDGVLYYFGEDGKAVSEISLASDGWKKVNGDWYYAKNQTLLKKSWISEGGYRYYLNSNGKMCKNTMYNVWDEELGYVRYRFDQAGHMVTGWYQSENNGKWYYYGIDGVGAEGIIEVDGKKYNFFESCMQTNVSVCDNGKLYYFGSDGVLAKEESLEADGWKQMPNGWYYAKNGSILRNRFITVGSYTYYLADDGRMAADEERYISEYVEDIDDWVEGHYRFDRSGHMVIGWYKAEDGNWYYYGKSGIAGSGIRQIDSTWYSFGYKGRMEKNTAGVLNGILYYFGDNGKAEKQISLDTDGWKQLPNGWYYAKDQDILTEEFITSGGYTYYLNGYGQMVADEERNIGWYDEELDEYFDVFCRFDKSGHMITGWYQDEDGERFYYGNNGYAATGIQKVGDEWYYFNYRGRVRKEICAADNGILYYFGKDGTAEKQVSLAADGWKQMPDGWYYAQAGTLLKDHFLTEKGYTYYMDYSGRMVSDCVENIYDEETDRFYAYRFDKSGHMVTGWYQSVFSEWYYYDENGHAKPGVQKINGTLYYFSNLGEMQTEICGIYDGVMYYFGKNGTVEKQQTITSDGWIEMPNGWHFVKNGEQLEDEWLKRGDYYYYLGYNGVMVESEERWIWDSETDQDYVYRFDKYGHMITGWYQDDYGRKFYYGENGRGWNGLQTVDGKQYYFINAEVGVNKTFFHDGVLYAADGNGNCSVVSTNGWVNNMFYLENGKPVTGWKKLSDKWYYFDINNGSLYRNRMYEINGKRYYFYVNGVMATGWLHAGTSEWIYANADGSLNIKKWTVIDGKQYYFDESGYMTTGIQKIDGKYQVFSDGGVWQKELSDQGDGWCKFGSDWYYAESGKFVLDETKTINGKTYVFDDTGKMRKNTLWDLFYLGQDGAAVTNTWKKPDNGHWFYFGEDGRRIESGWKKINGSWYYFDQHYAVCNDSVINGKLYHFSSGGASDGVGTTLASGWNLVNGNYYYYENNQLVKDGWKTIGSSRYYFNESGRMQYLSYIYDDDDVYFVDQNGRCVVGWYQDKYRTCYAGNDGKLIESGLHTIDGKQYYFADYALYDMDTISEDGTSLYQVDENGAVTEKIRIEGSGWKKTASGKWFYADKGVFVRGLRVINGKQYYFYNDGSMAANTMLDGTGYAGADGSLQFNGMVNGYYLVNGEAQIGAHAVNGKDYFFTYDGESLKGLAYSDGAYYQYDGIGGRTKATVTEGWNKIYDTWYYIKNNEMSRGFVDINGTVYHFDAFGRMLTDTFEHYRYFEERGYLGSNGLPVKGWKQIDSEWYYFNQNGVAVTGRQVIDGKTYMFDPYGRML